MSKDRLVTCPPGDSGGTLTDFVASHYPTLWATNADGTTSSNDEVPGSNPGGPPKNMGAIAQMVRAHVSSILSSP